jgi:hypothetical protein
LHQRLDDHRGHLVVVAGERALHVLEHAHGVVSGADACLAFEGVGRGRRDDIHEQRPVDGLVEIHVADRERAQGLAVIAVGERDEPRLAGATGVAPEMKAHLYRDFDGGGAVVGEETAVQARGRDSQQSFGERHRWLVREAGEDGVFEPA